MVIDTSALIAILLRESDYVVYREALVNAPRLVLSAANRFEAAMVITMRNGAAGRAELEALLESLDVEIYPVDANLARLAYEAWLRFGKGRHPAALNFGDCFAYALAKQAGEPLLFKGNDFSRTDIEPAV
jgi:ribonuclease VapC